MPSIPAAGSALAPCSPPVQGQIQLILLGFGVLGGEGMQGGVQEEFLAH